MHISWLGATAIRIQTKPSSEDIVAVIDAYKPKAGSAPRSLTAQIALFTGGGQERITISGNPFTLSTPGECDIKDVLITAVEGHDENNIMLRIDTEQMSIGHMGRAQKLLTERQREVLSEVDILCIPVGDNDCYDAETAVKVANELEPRIIIPMAFESDNEPKAEPIEKFLKEIGMAGKIVPEKKAIIKKKDLPQEETQVIVLSKE